MRTLEIRRHTMRNKPGSHLNQQGVDMARTVGETMGSFSKVVTSDKDRGFETAVAMGYSIDQQIPELGILPESVFQEISWPRSFSKIDEIASRNELSGNFADEQSEIWKNLVTNLPDNGRCLIISHGGILELGAVRLSIESSFEEWGGAIGYCEGLRFIYKDGIFKLDDMLRVDDCSRIISN